MEARGIDVESHNIDGHTALVFACNSKNQMNTIWKRCNQFVNNATLEKSAAEIGGPEDAERAAMRRPPHRCTPGSKPQLTAELITGANTTLLRRSLPQSNDENPNLTFPKRTHPSLKLCEEQKQKLNGEKNKG